MKNTGHRSLTLLRIVLAAVALILAPQLHAALVVASPVHVAGMIASQAAPEGSSLSEGQGKSQSEEGHENDAYRHSPTVQAISKMLHLPIETTARIFEVLNFLIIASAMFWFLFKAVPKAFRARTSGIQSQLLEARSATENANQRLSAVEARLARLDGEIAEIESQAQKDSVRDEERIRAAMEAEKQRILDSAEQEIASASMNAQLELKRFAAELALDQAAKRIAISDEADRELVKNFADGFGGSTPVSGRRN